MSSTDTTLDIARLTAGTPPTPDSLMVALIEQQQIIDKKSSVISNQKARIAVLEELLQQAKIQRFGASSEKNVLQCDLLFDEAERLADGEPDLDDDDPQCDDEPVPPKPPRKRKRRGFSPDLPRTQVRFELTDEERAGALDTFFVTVREELDITPAKVQVIVSFHPNQATRFRVNQAT